MSCDPATSWGFMIHFDECAYLCWGYLFSESNSHHQDDIYMQDHAWGLQITSIEWIKRGRLHNMFHDFDLTAVDGRNLHQLVVYPITRFIHSRWLAGFLPSTVS